MHLTKCLIATLWSGMSGSDMASSITSFASLVEQDNVIFSIFQNKQHNTLSCCKLGEATICMRENPICKRKDSVLKNDP